MRQNWRRIITVTLLLFVAVSVIYAVARETKQVNEPSGTSQAVVVYYFHGSRRCSSCLAIERYTAGSLQRAFGREIAEKQLSLEVVNVDEPENEHFVTDYELSSQTVVIRDPSGSWRKLDRVWELLADSAGFERYITSEVATDLERAR